MDHCKRCVYVATTRIHTCGPFVVGGSSGFNIDGIVNEQVDHNTEVTLEFAAGVVDPTYVTSMAVAPMISFACTDLATVLASFWLDGLYIPQTTVYTTLTAMFAKIGTTAPRMTSTSHFRAVVNNALIVPKQITANQGQRAELTVDVHCIYDGTNAPIVYTDSIALPHAASVDELFTVGKCSINGTALDGVQGVTLDFGIEVEKVFDSGNVYPVRAHVLSRRPKFEIRLKDTVNLSTYGIDGTAQSGTDSVIYFRKMQENAVTLAEATAEHLSFTIDDGKVTVGSTGGNNNTSFNSVVNIFPTYDGTNAILVKNLATAIS